MNISEIEQKIKDIETRSEEQHRGTFTLVNGNHILNSEVEVYKALLEDLEALRNYEAYVEQHKAVIEEYERRKNRVSYPGAYKVTEPAKKETKAQRKAIDLDNPNLEFPEITDKIVEKKEEPVIEKAEEIHVEVPVVEPVVEDKKEEVKEPIKVEVKQVKTEPKKKNRPATKGKKKVTNRRKYQKRGLGPQGYNLDLRGLEEDPVELIVPTATKVEEKVEDPKAVIDSKVPVIEPSTPVFGLPTSNYGLKRGEIIQDLPIRSKEEQSFNATGMSPEEIAASQAFINSIPTVDPKTYVDPIEEEIKQRQAAYDAEHKKGEPYKPMTAEEIEASRKKIGDNPSASAEGYKPMTDEEIEESKKKINPEPEKVEEPKEPTKEEKKKGKKKKVTKRRRFDWKNNKLVTGVQKSYYLLKGLIFGENMYGRTKDYVDLSMAIGSYRSVYKKRDIATNNAELQGLDTKIASSTLLTIEEKKRLYVKLGKLAKQVEKNNRIQQAKAAKATHNIVEELNEEPTLTR